MPQTKLTLRLDVDLIKRAKKAARRRGKSVSKMVADYFRTLESEGRAAEALPPLTRSLHGSREGSGLAEETYREHLEKKHG